MTFYNGATELGTGTVSTCGVATLTTSTLPGGTDSLTAIYGGESGYYAGSASSVLTQTVNKLAATVTLSNMTQTYTGSALSPTVTTMPAGLNTALTGASQTNAGSYPVTVTINDPNYSGTASGTFVINQAGQTISLGGVPASAENGSTFTVAATGGASGNAVVFTSAGACSNAGTTYTMTAAAGLVR